MSPKKPNQIKGKPISTPILIIAGVGVLALAFLYLQPTNDTASGPQPSNIQSTEEKLTTAKGPFSKDVTSSETEKKETGSENIFIDNVRDPFQPSPLVAKIKATPSKPVKSVEDEPTIQPVLPKWDKDEKITKVDKIEPVKPVTEENIISWKGTVAVKNDKLVIIKVKNRSHSLRLGDRVPGTDYIVAEISPESVLLISPKDQKRLTKKKEEK